MMKSAYLKSTNSNETLSINALEEFDSKGQSLEVIIEDISNAKIDSSSKVFHQYADFFHFPLIDAISLGEGNTPLIEASDKMNQYLRSEKRDDVSILMLVGGWLEALYILSSVNESHTTAELTERVGEQKMLCDNILFLVELYKEDTYFVALGDKIRALKKEYDGVKINNTVGEQIEKEIDGVLVVESTSTSSIEMTDEVLAKVTAKIKSIRLSLIETNEK